MGVINVTPDSFSDGGDYLHPEDAQNKAKQLLDLPVNNLSDQNWDQLHSRWMIWLEKLEKENLNIYFDGPTPYRFWKTNPHEINPEKESSLELGKYYQTRINDQIIRKSTKTLEKKTG